MNNWPDHIKPKNLKYAKLNDNQSKQLEEFTNSIFVNTDFSKINLF